MKEKLQYNIKETPQKVEQKIKVGKRYEKVANPVGREPVVSLRKKEIIYFSSFHVYVVCVHVSCVCVCV